MQVTTFNVGPLDNNTYVVTDDAGTAAAIVDPAFDSQGVWDAVVRRGLSVAWVIDTHAHLDHVAENAFFTERSGAPLALHADDLPLLRAVREQAAWFNIEPPALVEPGRLLADGDTIALGGEELRVVHTPGHSPGGVCLLAADFAIVGDVLFAGSVGRADLPGGDMDVLLQSIRARLLVLPDSTTVYPGHGPQTTIGIERRTNPYL
jgi:hydroxyacylglutathione hydrolase